VRVPCEGGALGASDVDMLVVGTTVNLAAYDVDGIPTSLSAHIVELVRQVAEDAILSKSRAPF
jgi:hypothetical protein